MLMTLNMKPIMIVSTTLVAPAGIWVAEDTDQLSTTGHESKNKFVPGSSIFHVGTWALHRVSFIREDVMRNGPLRGDLTLS